MRLFLTLGRPTALVVAVCALGVCGCAGARFPRIDPSGERILAPSGGYSAPRYLEVPGPVRASDCTELAVTPQEIVSPIGMEVVLVASVRGQDQYMRTNERVEWTLAPGGVGHFVDLDKATAIDYLVGDFTRPRKVDARFAITSTSRQYLRLSRGTPALNDDVCIRPGQAWVSITSPVEGTSVVTAYAPSVYGWDRRTRSATIHWVDAQWTLPSPAISPAGSRHVLVTTVTRQRDQSPCVGWRVRYQIVEGPVAALGPAGATTAEVSTDEAGQAKVEIFQPQPAPGTNRVAICVIRPAEVSGSAGKRLEVGSGSVLVTWSAPSIGLRVSGPASGSLGAVLAYRLNVSNPGDPPAADVVVSAAVPPGLAYRDSSPPAELAGSVLRWRVGRLGAGEARALDVRFLAQTQGTISFCGEATAAGGLKTKDCATTAISTAILDVKIFGPQQATVGQSVTFEIHVTNRSQIPATSVVIKDTFDAGLVHEQAIGAIERELPDGIKPGETRRVGVVFRVGKAGVLCHTVEVTAAGQSRASAKVCLTAVQPGTPSSSGVAPGAPPMGAPGAPSVPPVQGMPGSAASSVPGVPSPSGSGLPSVPGERASLLAVELLGPSTRRVGETADFSIELTNTSTRPLNNLEIVCNIDRPFDIRNGRATEGFKLLQNVGAAVSVVQWSLPSLPAGTASRFQLQMRCIEASPSACCRVVVTSQEERPVSAEKCVAIGTPVAPASANLALLIEDPHESIAVGREKTLVIRVTNQGPVAQNRVALTVFVPDRLVIDNLRTRGPTECQVQAGTVRCQPAASLAPGQTLEYRVRVKARQTGEATVRAEVSSASSIQPVVVEKKTIILP